MEILKGLTVRYKMDKINGEGIKDVNWRMLIHALRVGPKLNALADDIVAALAAHD